MKNQSVDWAEYAHAQRELKNSMTSNDRHWGLEYALNKTLDDIQAANSFDRSDVERHIRSGARLNRHRRRLVRLQPLTWQPETVDPTVATEARSELEFLQSEIVGFDLLEKVAQGYSYKELAQPQGPGSTSLRKRVSRLRNLARNSVQRT